MGWGSGATLMSNVIGALIENNAPDNARRAVYMTLIRPMQNMDWDTEQDCMGEDPIYDAVLKELEPEWFEDEG